MIRLICLWLLVYSYQQLEASVQWVPSYTTVIATAYCPCEICCGVYSDGKTATGRSAWTKGVAIDPKIIKLGSRLDIPGYGVWVKADDVGGSVKGNRIDVRFLDHEEAIRWGVKKLKIRVWTKR